MPKNLQSHGEDTIILKLWSCNWFSPDVPRFASQSQSAAVIGQPSTASSYVPRSFWPRGFFLSVNCEVMLCHRGGISSPLIFSASRFSAEGPRFAWCDETRVIAMSRFNLYGWDADELADSRIVQTLRSLSQGTECLVIPRVSPLFLGFGDSACPVTVVGLFRPEMKISPPPDLVTSCFLFVERRLQCITKSLI